MVGPFVSLHDKHVLVTGAARGIGRATALAAAEAGARVTATDVVEDELGDTLRQLGPEAKGMVTDLRSVSDIERLVRTAATSSRIDALLHVAGSIVRRETIDEVTEDDWDLQHTVNLKATFFLDRAVARVMKTHGGGSIVNFSSQGWWSGGFGGSVVYSASKGGVVSLSRGLARTLAPHGIRVNVVAPGLVDTAMMSEGLTADAVHGMVAQVPMGRLGEPDEIARAALFLASDAATYITGATLNVSGGQLMY